MFLSSQDLSATQGHTFVRRELPVGGEIPDLIYVTFEREPPNDVWPPRWTFQHAFILWQLRRGRRLQPGTIAKRSFMPVERTSAYLEHLASSGAVQQTATGSYILSPQLAQLSVDVLAVEAKLTRWREALGQARSYATFADRVAVAMDSAGVPRSRRDIAAFRRHGIGLLAVDADHIEWLVTPKRRHPARSPEREYMIASASDPLRQRSWSLL